MRGLKPNGYPTTGRRNRRIFYRCVDWNKEADKPGEVVRSRIFYRCVDWNIEFVRNKIITRRSHLLQMRGLKRYLAVATLAEFVSHLLQMRGLKQMPLSRMYWSFRSHLLQMRGLKHVGVRKRKIWTISRIFYRCVDWNRTLGVGWFG